MIANFISEKEFFLLNAHLWKTVLMEWEEQCFFIVRRRLARRARRRRDTGGPNGTLSGEDQDDPHCERDY